VGRQCQGNREKLRAPVHPDNPISNESVPKLNVMPVTWVDHFWHSKDDARRIAVNFAKLPGAAAAAARLLREGVRHEHT